MKVPTIAATLWVGIFHYTESFPSESPRSLIDGRLVFIWVQTYSASEADLAPTSTDYHILCPKSTVEAFWPKIPSSAQIQFWREKVTICTILLLLSSIFLFLVEGFPRILCLYQAPFTAEKLNGTKLVLIHGEVIDLTKSKSALGEFSKKYPGQDISSAVPLYDLLARHNRSKTYPNPKINACISKVQFADAWLRKTLESPGYTIKDRAMQNCPDPSNPTNSVPCFFKKEVKDEIKRRKVADYYYSEAELKKQNWGDLLAISSAVYDVKSLLDPQLDSKNNLNPKLMLFSLDVSQKIRDAASKRNTQELLKIPKWSDYQACLRLMFYRGKVMQPSVLGLEPECLPWLTTLVVTAIPLGLLFLKLFLSFIPPPKPLSPHTVYSSCILFVPCFNETREELEACLGTMIETNYIDHGKLLFVVCDGQFCGDDVLDILSHQGPGSEPKSYQSVGKGNKAINSAQVYSGYHYHGAHGVPYIVVVKTGNVHEAEFSGNRGKRDSMLIALNFLDGISSPENLLTPLEAELLESIQGLDLVPSSFNYMFCVDADTQVDPDSLPLMLHYLDSRPDCLAVSGQLRFNSGGHWLLDPLQRFRACFSRHQDMCAMSALDTLTSLNGGFTAYRLQQTTGTRCLIHEDVVFQLSSKRTNTLHTKHLLLLGEEQYIATLLLRCWPGLRLGYVPGAFAKTVGYASLWQLIVKERSAFCTKFHNLLDLWTSSAVWGISWVTFIWVSTSILWCFLMPVFTGFLYLQLVRVVILRGLPFLVLPFLAGACLFLSLVFCLLNYHPGLIIGLILYLLVGIPLYHVIIPLYSFLSMDNFNWYDLGGDQTRARPHGAMEEVLGRPIKAMHDRSMRPHEKSFKHISYHSAFLPAPGGFQSLYTELNQMGMPINMPGGEHSMAHGLPSDTVPLAVFPNHSAFMSDSSYGNIPNSAAPRPPQLAALTQQQPMRISLPPRTPLTARNIPGLRDSIAVGKSFNRAQVRMSESHGPSFNFEPVPSLGLAKDFPLPPSINSEMRQRESLFAATHSSLQSSVLGAGGFLYTGSQFVPPSVPNSEYNSDFSLSVASLAHYDTYLEDNASLQSSLPGDRFSRNVTGTNGLPATSAPRGPDNPEAIQQSKAMIREEIDYFLRDADLHTVTRREVKEHLLAVFGDNVSFYQDFVSQCIEEFTLERLATQDPQFHNPTNGVRSSQLL